MGETLFLLLFFGGIIFAIYFFLKKNKENIMKEQEVIKSVIGILESGDLDYRDDSGKTVAMIAASSLQKYAGKDLLGYIDVLKKCVSLGLDLNVVNEADGKTALHYAIEKEYGLEEVRYLIDNGADVNILGAKKANALIVAAKSNAEAYKLIVDKTDDINYQRENGITALMVACQHMNIPVIDDLLDRGADLKIKNSSGRDALAVAKLYQKDNHKHSGDSANGNVYEKHNFMVDETIRKIQCLVDGKKYKKKKFRAKAQRSISGE